MSDSKSGPKIKFNDSYHKTLRLKVQETREKQQTEAIKELITLIILERTNDLKAAVIDEVELKEKKSLDNRKFSPFYQNIEDYISQNYSSHFESQEEIHAYIESYTTYNTERIQEQIELQKDRAWILEYLEILTEQTKAFKCFENSSLHGKTVRGEKAQKQYWSGIMHFLKGKGFDYYTSRKIADQYAYRKGIGTEKYQILAEDGDPLKTQQVTYIEDSFDPEINDWNEKEQTKTEQKEHVTKTQHEIEEADKKYLEKVDLMLVYYVKEGYSDEQLEEWLSMRKMDARLKRKLLERAKQLRKPPVTIRINYGHSKSESEDLQQEWINCMAYKSGKPDSEGRMHEAEPFDNAVELCTFQTFKYTGLQPSETSFEKVKNFWEPGYWFNHKEMLCAIASGLNDNQIIEYFHSVNPNFDCSYMLNGLRKDLKDGKIQLPHLTEEAKQRYIMRGKRV